MAGYVVDPVDSPALIGDDAVIFDPAPGQTYWILSADGVEQPNLDRYPTYIQALDVANSFNAGLDQIDRRYWVPVEKVQPE